MMQNPYGNPYVMPVGPVHPAPSPYMNSYEPVPYPMERNQMPYTPQGYMPQPMATHSQAVEQTNVPRKRQQLLMEEAIPIAREQVEGQVVEAELKRKHGRQIFEVEIINPQNVKYEVEIDANTGEVNDVSLD